MKKLRKVITLAKKVGITAIAGLTFMCASLDNSADRRSSWNEQIGAPLLNTQNDDPCVGQALIDYGGPCYGKDQDYSIKSTEIERIGYEKLTDRPKVEIKDYFINHFYNGRKNDVECYQYAEQIYRWLFELVGITGVAKNTFIANITKHAENLLLYYRELNRAHAHEKRDCLPLKKAFVYVENRLNKARKAKSDELLEKYAEMERVSRYVLERVGYEKLTDRPQVEIKDYFINHSYNGRKNNIKCYQYAERIYRWLFELVGITGVTKDMFQTVVKEYADNLLEYLKALRNSQLGENPDIQIKKAFTLVRCNISYVKKNHEHQVLGVYDIEKRKHAESYLYWPEMDSSMPAMDDDTYNVQDLSVLGMVNNVV